MLLLFKFTLMVEMKGKEHEKWALREWLWVMYVVADGRDGNQRRNSRRVLWGKEGMIFKEWGSWHRTLPPFHKQVGHTPCDVSHIIFFYLFTCFHGITNVLRARPMSFSWGRFMTFEWFKSLICLWAYIDGRQNMIISAISGE